MTRGSGKFKTKRGGGRNFSRHLQLDENGTAFAVDKWAARGKVENDDDDDSEEDEEESEEESEEEEESAEEIAGPSASGQPEMTRAERKASKKAATDQKKKVAFQGEGEEGDSDDADLVNPNRTTAKSKKLSDLNTPEPLSRREREAKEKQEAKERYWKAHLAGKTDQAKADLARLARIRKEREEAEARRKAEADAKAAEIQAKATAQGRKR